MRFLWISSHIGVYSSDKVDHLAARSMVRARPMTNMAVSIEVSLI